MNNYTLKSWTKGTQNVPELEGVGCAITVMEQPVEFPIRRVEYDETVLSETIGPTSKARRPWRPLTQKAYFLLAVVLASVGIIAVLQSFLHRSQRDSGIVFAPNVNNLPAGQTFCYLYLPTIIALTLSFAWTWIDLDVKRLQPFWQLSRKGGAHGKDSVLLHYPFDFVALVPLRAIRQRHWPVFSASFAVVIILWGLTPLQSSIFATKNVVRSSVLPTASSTGSLSLDKQTTLLTGGYTQSVYNIAWLNETLPPFMSREGMLAPFGLITQADKLHKSETWTARTRLYSVDIHCYDAFEKAGYWLGQHGCEYNDANLPAPKHVRSDQYTSTYVGYWYEESMDSYLSGSCSGDDKANRTFLLQWSRGRRQSGGYPLASTTLYCESSYYQQDVNATVVPPHMSVSQIVPIGLKRPLPSNLFNITDFEWSMSAGVEKLANRGAYPATSGWPDATERIQYLDLALRWDFLPPLSGYAFAAYKRPAAEYMNATLLRDSYQTAYRLLFARRLADILSPNLDNATQIDGVRSYQTQALTLVPAFVYVVEAFIATTALAACTILCLSYITANALSSDPANLASTMALVADDSVLRQAFDEHDCSSSDSIEDAFTDSTFGLLRETKLNSDRAYGLKMFGHPSGQRSVPRTIVSADRFLPWELSWAAGSVFFSVQLCVVAILVYTFVRSQTQNGLPLPSTSIFISQIVEHYIPMAVAACFEPAWVVLNRLICLLQPYEELRRGNARAARTLTVDYSSLPPQAVVTRALRAGHLSLAAICAMAILANVLSIAFNSILFEETVNLASKTTFTQPYSLPLNGTTIGNSSLTLNRKDYDPFYVAMTNMTAGTPLPAWTDGTFFYLPFQNSTSQATDTTFRATTRAVRPSLECVPLSESELNSNNYKLNSSALNATMLFSDTAEPCHVSVDLAITDLRHGSAGHVAAESLIFTDKSNTSACDHVIVAGWLRSVNTSSSNSAHFGPQKTSWIGCKPKIQMSLRQVTVDSQGIVLGSDSQYGSVNTSTSVFEPSYFDFTASVHNILNQTDRTLGPTWHNDSYPSDFFGFLTATAIKHINILDPSLPPPTPDYTIPALEMVYAKLFTIILGTNIEKILRPTEGDNIHGVLIRPERRVFVSRSMFIVSMIVLVLYLLSTATIYIRRPWKILPRMPTTIASQIAFFAASHTLEDLKGTSAMTTQGRNRYVESLGSRYGFGRFLGTDSKTHVGIEREPLVQPLRKEDL